MESIIVREAIAKRVNKKKNNFCSRPSFYGGVISLFIIITTTTSQNTRYNVPNSAN